MIRKSFIILFFILSFFESISQKKELLFENFNINKGISHNTVHDIVQEILPEKVGLYSGKAPKRLSISADEWNIRKRINAYRLKSIYSL